MTTPWIVDVGTLVRALRLVADRCGVTVNEIRGRSRTQHVSRARGLAAYVIRSVYGTSYPRIGRALGGYDHSTVITACRVAEARIATDRMLRDLYEGIRDELRKGVTT